MEKKKKLHWFTETKYIDQDTGEQLEKRNAIINYTITETKTSHKVAEAIGIKQITYICKKSNQLAQLELFKKEQQ